MKKFIIVLVLVASLMPIFNISYHVEGVGTESRVVSIVNIIVGDVVNGTLGTR